MIAKLILTFLLAGVVLYAWHEQRRSPLVAKLSLIAATSGMYFVWVPSHALILAAQVRGLALTCQHNVSFVRSSRLIAAQLGLDPDGNGDLQSLGSADTQAAVSRLHMPREPLEIRSPVRVASTDDTAYVLREIGEDRTLIASASAGARLGFGAVAH